MKKMRDSSALAMNYVSFAFKPAKCPYSCPIIARYGANWLILNRIDITVLCTVLYRAVL